jgi:acyl carrier protein
MKKDQSIVEIAEYCEFEGGPFSLNTELNSIDGFDSFSILSIIAYIDEQFNVKISAERIAKLSDFNSLIKEIGINNFEDV